MHIFQCSEIDPEIENKYLFEIASMIKSKQVSEAKNSLKSQVFTQRAKPKCLVSCQTGVWCNPLFICMLIWVTSTAGDYKQISLNRFSFACFGWFMFRGLWHKILLKCKIEIKVGWFLEKLLLSDSKVGRSRLCSEEEQQDKGRTVCSHFGLELCNQCFCHSGLCFKE